MTLKSKKQVINEILETFFGRDDKILFYFLKKRKNLSNDELIIPFKTRKKVNQKKIKDVESLIREKTGEPPTSN